MYLNKPKRVYISMEKYRGGSKKGQSKFLTVYDTSIKEIFNIIKTALIKEIRRRK